MFHFIMTTSFQYIKKTIDITFHISIRILNRISYSSLCCKIYNLIKMLISKKHLHSLFVLKIHANKTKRGIFRTSNKLIPVYIFLRDAQCVQTTIFQVYVIIIIQIIQPDDFITTFQQTPAYIRANKTGCTGN